MNGVVPALTHEVAYGSLLQERRRGLHARVLQVIERLYAERLSEYTERLAHHALRAETWPVAITYLRGAGLRAQARSAHREAASYLEQALETLPHLPENRETLALGVDLRLDLRTSLVATGRLGSVVEHLRQAEATAAALDDPRRLGVVSAYMGHYCFATGDYLGAIACGERALAFASQGEDLAVQVEANYRVGLGHYQLGDYRRPIACFQASIALLPDDLRDERFGLPYLPYVNSRFWRSWALIELGEFREATASLNEALPVATTSGQLWSLADMELDFGRVRLEQGEFQEAVPRFERAKQLCEVGGLLYLMPFVNTLLGAAYTHVGRVAEALPLLEAAVQLMIDIQFLGLRSWVLAHLAEGYLAAGRDIDAERIARQALQVARDQQARGMEAQATRLLVEIAARGEPLQGEQAVGEYRRTLGVAEELGMRPLVAHCHLGLGTLYRKSGRDELAQGELATAAEMYRAMEMTFWLERAEQELALTRS